MKQYKEIIDNIEYHVIDYENEFIFGSEWVYDSKKYKYCLQINDRDVEFRYTKNGKNHRDNNLPAYKHKNGHIEYSYNGLLHRADGPAIIYEDSRKSYYINGVFIDVDSDEGLARYLNLINFE